MKKKRRTRKTETENQRCLRAIVVSGDKALEKQKSNALDPDRERESEVTDARFILPPYEPDVLALLPENSSELVQCIEAMEINIEGFGQRLVLREISDEEQAKNEVAIKRERTELKGFIDITNPDDNLTSIRRKLRKDIEIQGNGYWEVLTSTDGALSGLNYLRARHMRITKQDREHTEIKIRYLDEDLNWVTKTFFKRFRRFVQRVGSNTIFFKEWDDPRVINKTDGHVIERPTQKDMKDNAATGVMHFKIQSGRTSYGLPRLIGNLFSIFGSRASDVINFQTFKNNNIPSMVVTVSNGMLTQDTIDRIEEYVNSHIKRSDNWSKFLILEGETQDEESQNAGAMKIDLKPLTSQQHTDQLFQNYDANNSEKIRRSFRLPNIFVGKTENINRACYSSDTETLTENGWKLYPDILEDERIATFNPENNALEYHLPISKHVYDYNGEMIRFRNQNCDILVTPDHKMWVSTKVKNDWSKIDAQDVTDISPRLKFRSSPDFYQPDVQEVAVNLVVPGYKNQKAQRDDITIPMVLAAELFACYAADGCASPSFSNGKKVSKWVRFSAKKQRKIDQFRGLIQSLSNLGFTSTKEWTDSVGMTHNCIVDEGLWSFLKINCGATTATKTLPDTMIHQCKEISKICLDALKNTDGTQVSLNAWHYATVSPELADQVQIIAVQSGHRANLNVSIDRRENRKPLFRVMITEDKPVHQINDHQIERELYDGKVYCYEVPNHLFVTRRNGRVAIQGNTTEASRRLAEEQVFGPEREEMDRRINRLLMHFGFKYHVLKSNSPNVTDDAALTKVISGAEKSGALTPNFTREIIGDILNKEIPPIEKTDKFDPDIPFSLTMAEAVKKRDGIAPNQGQLGDGEENDKPDPNPNPLDDNDDQNKILSFFQYMENPAMEFDKELGMSIFADEEDDGDELDAS